jgi:hypothetical protein
MENWCSYGTIYYFFYSEGGHPNNTWKSFFFWNGGKVCLSLLIKKKRIAQLIYGKPSENRYKHIKANRSQSKKRQRPPRTRQTLPTHKTATLTLEQHHKDHNENTSTKALSNTKPQNDLKQPEKPKSVHQVVAGVFPMAPLFLSLHLRDFSFRIPVWGQSPTFLLLLLLLPLFVIPVRRQTIALPNPGLAVYKLLSKSQSSFANRASGLSPGGDGVGVEATSDRSGELKVVVESIFICSLLRVVVYSRRGSRLSLCVVDNQPVGNPKRKVWWI